MSGFSFKYDFILSISYSDVEQLYVIKMEIRINNSLCFIIKMVMSEQS